MFSIFICGDMNKFSKFLKLSLKSQNESIKAYHVDGQIKVWLKKASERHPVWIYLPLKYLANVLKIKALTPIPNHGGATAIQCEVQRIQELQDIGIPTPTVLAVSNQGLLLEDVSQSGEHVVQLDHALAMLKDDSHSKLEFFQEAIEAIQKIHEKDSYLSEAFARNILVNKNKEFTFIDFETDPGHILDVETCQIRDWLCFIFSTAYRFSKQELKCASQIFINAIFTYRKIFKGILNIGRKLRWANIFKFEKLGNDGIRIQKCLTFLELLEDQQPLPMI